MRIGQLTQRVRRSFTMAIVHFAITDEGYIKVLPIEMGGGTGRLRAEKRIQPGEATE
jgi:tartrate dehydratase alpha subunit/fumarate hydratase class I-like protein